MQYTVAVTRLLTAAVCSARSSLLAQEFCSFPRQRSTKNSATLFCQKQNKTKERGRGRERKRERRHLQHKTQTKSRQSIVNNHLITEKRVKMCSTINTYKCCRSFPTIYRHIYYYNQNHTTLARTSQPVRQLLLIEGINSCSPVQINEVSIL